MKDLEEMINIYHGDLFDALPEFFQGEDSLENDPLKNKVMQSYHQQYDLIMTNPPYVTKEDMTTLPKEYTYEPSIALEAGEDGLEIVDRILKESYHYLKDGGGLLCEVGQCKEALEKKYKKLFHVNSKKVHWIATDQSQQEVFYIKKEHLHPDNF
jgi:ribosomal protein L3 glutamine methyltransferase